MLALICFVVPATFSFDALPQLPGVNQLGSGFDLTIGRRPAQARPIVASTFLKNRTFANPQDVSIIYSIPDQLQVYVETAIQSDISTGVHYSARSWGKSHMDNVHIGGSGSIFGYPWSASADMSHVEQTLSNREQYSAFIHSQMVATVYQASLPSNVSFTAEFLADLEGLPRPYDTETVEAYHNFFNKYGTHILFGAYFGGRGVQQVSLNAADAQRYGTDDVRKQANIKFGWFQTGGSGKDADSWFEGSGSKTSELHTFMEGGDPGLASDLKNWGKWITSFFRFPALIFSEKYPASMLSITEAVNAGHASFNTSDLELATRFYLGATPYPADPECMDGVLNPSCGGRHGCCTKEYPVCCYDEPTSSQMCYSNWGSVCCSDHACAPGTACCHDGCTGAGGHCCAAGHWCDEGDSCCGSGCIPGDAQCCENGNYCKHSQGHCCENGNYCCKSDGISEVQTASLKIGSPNTGHPLQPKRSAADSLTAFMSLMNEVPQPA